MCYSDHVASSKKEDREDAFVPLGCTMHHSLLAQSELIRVTLEVKHQDFYHVAITSGCGKMNGLRAHMTVSMLGHLDLSCFVI